MYYGEGKYKHSLCFFSPSSNCIQIYIKFLITRTVDIMLIFAGHDINEIFPNLASLITADSNFITYTQIYCIK